MKIILTFILFTSLCAAQDISGTDKTGRKYAEQQLKAALSDSDEHNIVDNQVPIIKDTATAIAMAEPILFSIYKRENIVKQKPYNVLLIDNHWIIFGSLPEGYVGGTFLIIMDDRNGKILKISHGK